jgi:hypothetical protein
MRVLIFILFLFISKASLGWGGSFDSVAVFEQNGETKVYFRAYSMYSNTFMTLNRIEQDFIFSDTTVQFELFFRPCSGPIVDTYFDTILTVDPLYSQFYSHVNIRLVIIGDTSSLYDPVLGCGSSSMTFMSFSTTFSISDQLASLSKEYISEHTRLFPNPASSEVKVISASNVVFKELVIVDQSGREIRREPFAEVIDVTELSEGLYVLLLNYANGSVYKRLIVK